jgi:hypothetical protein
MTQLNSTNPEMKSFIDTLCGYPNDVYLELAKSPTLSYYIGYSNISLTLVNELLHTIASTPNRKRRRATIVRLVSMFMGCNLQARLTWYTQPTRRDWMTSYTKLLADLTYYFRGQYPTPTEQRNLDSTQLRVLHRDNVPWWTALVVGDSKHYNSCLRSGVLNCKGFTTMEWDEQRWLELLNEGCDSYGCNYYEFIQQEVTAFKAGHIMYLVAGDMVYDKVGSTGPQARMRVHVASMGNGNVTDFTDDNAIYIVDRMYGVTALCSRLLQLLLEQYPGRVYVNSRHDYISRSSKAVQVTLCDDRVYSDSLMEYATQLMYVQSKLGGEVIRVRDNVVYRCYVNAGITTHTRREPPKQPDDPHNLPRSHREHRQSIALLSSYYGVPYTVGSVDDATPASSYIQLGVRFSDRVYRVAWTFRGVSYELRENYNSSAYTFLCYRNEYEYIYNLRTGTWEQSIRYFTSSKDSDYFVTRHTIKLIGKYLPKHPNTRPRKKRS